MKRKPQKRSIKARHIIFAAQLASGHLRKIRGNLLRRHKTDYDKKIQLAEISYDERLLNQMKIIRKTKEMGHEVVK